MTVLIAGAGVAGLTMGLTLHQIGVPFRIFEAVQTVKPLGVGINIQPNAVRELFELGLEAALDRAGVRTKEYGFSPKPGKRSGPNRAGISQVTSGRSFRCNVASCKWNCLPPYGHAYQRRSSPATGQSGSRTMPKGLFCT